VSPTSVATGSRLQDKTAVIFGAGGEVGAAVANAFARQGARVFLSGRTVAHVKAVADAIPDSGTVAGVAELDALDEDAVRAYLDDVVAADGRIDIVFNAIGPQAAEYGNATSTMDLPVEKFLLPISTIVASNFITARAATRHLLRQGTGVVVFLSGTPSQGTANTTAIGAAFGALESLTRSLAVDLSPHGVRVVCVRTMGMAETRIMHQTYELAGQAMGAPKEKIEQIVTSRALLGRPPSLVDTAGLITFLASDEANTITGAIINSSCGQVLD
jgi:NAD(P)-dependent dehydrogenase (short-subunit alcohol dehydrogenase family)